MVSVWLHTSQTPPAHLRSDDRTICLPRTVGPDGPSSPFQAGILWYLKARSSVTAKLFASIYMLLFTALQGEKGALEVFYHPMYTAKRKYVYIFECGFLSPWCYGHFTSLKQNVYSLQLKVRQTSAKPVLRLVLQSDSSQLVWCVLYTLELWIFSLPRGHWGATSAFGV